MPSTIETVAALIVATIAFALDAADRVLPFDESPLVVAEATGSNFNADYYSALAQVIPVLLIAVVYLSYFKHGDDGKRARDETKLTPGLASFLVGTVLGGVVSELIVLETLRSKEELVGVEVMVVGLTLGGLALLFAAEFVAPPLQRLWQEVPEGYRGPVQIGGALLVLSIFLATVAFGFDPYWAFAAIVVAFYVGPSFVRTGADVAGGVRRFLRAASRALDRIRHRSDD